MRILSQDGGKIDVSYEKVIVQISGNGDNSIIAYTNSEGDGYLTMAEYSTEAKAQRAMEILHEAYQYAEECKFTGVGAKQPEFLFQFPADDEIEV